MLPLAPLYHACERQPDKVPALIGEYVASVEHQLTPQPAIDAVDVAVALVCAQRPLSREPRSCRRPASRSGRGRHDCVRRRRASRVDHARRAPRRMDVGRSDRRGRAAHGDGQHRGAFRSAGRTHRADGSHSRRRVARRLGCAVPGQPAPGASRARGIRPSARAATCSSASPTGASSSPCLPRCPQPIGFSAGCSGSGVRR